MLKSHYAACFLPINGYPLTQATLVRDECCLLRVHVSVSHYLSSPERHIIQQEEKHTMASPTLSIEEATLPTGTAVQQTEPQDLEAAEVIIGDAVHPKVGYFYFCYVNSRHLGYNLCVWLLLGVIALLVAIFKNGVISAIPCVILATICVPYCAYSLQVKDFLDEAWKTEEEAVQIIKQTITKKPRLQQNLKCFHMSRVSSGNDVKVVTFKMNTPKQFIDWYDCSPDHSVVLKELKLQDSGNRRFKTSRKAKRIYINPSYQPADAETKQDFSEQARALIREHGTKDEEFTYSEQYSIPSIPSMILLNRGSSQRSFWFSHNLYLLCVILSCAFPFRFCLEFCCVESRVWENKKVLSVNDFDGNVIREAEEGEEAEEDVPIVIDNTEIV